MQARSVPERSTSDLPHEETAPPRQQGKCIRLCRLRHARPNELSPTEFERSRAQDARASVPSLSSASAASFKVSESLQTKLRCPHRVHRAMPPSSPPSAADTP